MLLCIARDPEIRLRDVAAIVGITERAAQSIVADLVDDGCLTRSRIGRRNHYAVHRERPLRHMDNSVLTVGGLLDYLQGAIGLMPIASPMLSGIGNGHLATNGHGHHS